MAKKKYPADTKFGNWFPVREGKNWRIRRMATPSNGKRQPQRLDRKTYDQIPNNYEAILKHCDRLNFGVNMAKQREVEIVSAFLPDHIISGFHAELLAVIPDAQYANYLFNRALKEYFLGFFINHLKIPDPKLWAKRQTEWGRALVAKDSSYKIFDSPVSARTITLVIQTANRFLKYLHQQMSTTYPLIQLSPVSKAVLKLYSVDQLNEPIGKFITEEDWNELQKHLSLDIRPFIHLMYFYGLRRSESLGFQNTDSVKKSYLQISHQLKSIGENPIYSPLKNREQRKTPHWFCSVATCHKLVSQTLNHKMHADTLSAKWDELMENLGWEYRLHDFRRTFITRALRIHNPRDVQLAVGHADLRTTMKYAQDDRDMGDEIWKPVVAS